MLWVPGFKNLLPYSDSYYFHSRRLFRLLVSVVANEAAILGKEKQELPKKPGGLRDGTDGDADNPDSQQPGTATDDDNLPMSTDDQDYEDLITDENASQDKMIPPTDVPMIGECIYNILLI